MKHSPFILSCGSFAPLLASDAEEAAALALRCRGVVSAPATVTGEFMYMPAGLHSVTLTQGIPGQKGKTITVQVKVDPLAAAALDQQRQAIAARGKDPYFDFNHEDGEASYRPSAFLWKNEPAPGVYCKGEWTLSGKQGVEGKAWKSFSPVFHVNDTKANPAAIACQPYAHPNMGGLVNNPAFSAISPLWAKAAGATSDQERVDDPTNPNADDSIMTKEQLAALQAKIQGLEAEVQSLMAKAKGDNADTEAKHALAAKQAELRADRADLRAAQLEADNTTLQAADKARREKDADAAIQAAITSGALAAKDTETQASWKALIIADPKNAVLLGKQAGNPALGGRVTPAAAAVTREALNARDGGAIAIINQDPHDILKAYAALVAKNTEIPLSQETHKAKGALALQAAQIFTDEIENNGRFQNIRIEDALRAADFSDPGNNVGVLSGTLVLQRAMALMQYEYPVMTALYTDFSDAPGLLNQTENTRVILKPAVQTYNTGTDSAGRPLGWTTVSPAQTIDVPITLDEYVGVPIVFGNNVLGSTVRDLFGEVAPQAMYALGGYFVNKATALMTTANFNAYAAVSDAAGQTVNNSATLIVGSTAGLYPGQIVSGAGIPANTFILSVTDGTHAVMNNKATASAAGLAITYGTGKVPTTYTSYIKALADFNLASLDDLAIALDTNEVPQQDRLAMLNAQYYRKLRQDPSLNMFFAAQQMPEIITKGRLPELTGFAPYNAPYLLTANNRVGFAGHKASIVLKTRLPNDFTKALGAAAPGTVTTVTNPVTGISVLLVQYISLRENYAEWRIEVQLGAAVGDRRGGLVLTSQ